MDEQGLVEGLRNRSEEARSLAAFKLADSKFTDALPALHTAMVNEFDSITKVDIAESEALLGSPEGVTA